MQRNILQGSEFLLYNIENVPVAYSTNCVLKINQNLADVTHKDSGSWSEFMVGLKNWSIEFDGLVSYGDGFNTSFFLSKFKNPEPFFIKFGIVQENFTHAFVGEVNIESIEQTAEDGEVVSYSGTLKGIGHLSFSDEGAPIQNGYIKVESDPIFRGSPAFNITETNKQDWNQAYSKIVNEVEFIEEIDKTTLKIKFKDGTYYSSSFKPVVPVLDLSGYYTKAQADSKILVAQVAADQANTLLSAIASDSKLTPSEKPNVLKEWQIIQDEKDKLVAQAVAAYVQTIEYDIAFLDLERYLEPLLESMLTTTSIIGYEFRAYFRNYYDQKILLLKSISKAQVDNVKIGVRNYHFNGDKAVLVHDTANQLLQEGNYPLNSEMAVSFLARSIDGTNKLYLEFEGKEAAQFNITADWIDCSCVISSGDVAKLYARIGGSTSIFNISRFVATAYDTFPYLFPMSFDGTNARNGIEIKNIMVVQGNKPTSFVPAPEDFKQLVDKAKVDASNAAKQYSDLQIELNNIVINAEIDGKIDETEARLIADAQTKLDAAKAYADAQALNAKILANSYSDGLIDDIESKLLNASDTNIAAAKAYTDSQRTLSELNIKSWADGKIDSTEAALIANAENNLAAAKAYSDQQDLYTKTLSDAYADHLISQEEQKRLDAVQASLNAAKLFTTAQRELSETITKAYADGVVDESETKLIADATAKMNAAKAYADSTALALKSELKDYVDTSIVEKANEIIANTTSQINVANTATLQAAKSDAEAKIEIARLAAITASNNYTTAQRIAAETTAQVYADGIVTLEEQARLTQAANNLAAAKQDATEKANTAAQYGIAAQNLHNALIGNLKSLAYSDVVEVSKLGSTVVQGGFLKTSLLNADYIKSGIITADYINSLQITANNITATTGTIGTWSITSKGLKDTTGSAYILSQVPHAGGGKTEVGIGLSATSSSNPDTPSLGSEYFAAKFYSTSVRSNGYNTGIYAEASGGSLLNTAIRAKGQVALEANGSINLTSGSLNLGAGTSIITANGKAGITTTVRLQMYDPINGAGRTYNMEINNGLITGFIPL